MNGAEADNYNQPFHASDAWWSGLDGVVQQMLITAGTDEVLLDVIAAFAKRMEVRIFECFEFGDVGMLTLVCFVGNPSGSENVAGTKRVS